MCGSSYGSDFDYDPTSSFDRQQIYLPTGDYHVSSEHPDSMALENGRGDTLSGRAGQPTTERQLLAPFEFFDVDVVEGEDPDIS